MITNLSTIRSILRVFAATAVAIAMATSAQAQLTTWTGGANSTWSDAGNWTNAVPNTTTGTAVFTSSASQTTITNGPRIDFRSLVFRSGALAYNIGPNFGISGNGSITVESGVSNNQTINGNVRNAAGTTTSTITNNGTGLLNFPGQFFSGGAWTVTFDGSGDITARSLDQQNSAGVFSIVKNGSGTLTLTTGLSAAAAASTGHYTGSTTINAGVLQLGDANSMGGSTTGTGAITFGGGTLRYGSATVDYSSRIRSSGSAIAINTGTLATVTYNAGLDSSNTGGLTKSGTGVLQLNGTNAFTGNIAVNQGSLYVNGNGVLGSSGTFAGSITMGNGVSFWYRSDANQTLTGSIVSTDASSIFSVRHAAPLGTGTLTLAAANPGFTSRMIVGQASETTVATLLVSNSNALQNARLETRSNDKVAFAPGIGTFNVGSLFSGTANGNGNFALNDTAGNAITLSVGGNNRTESAFESVLSGLGGLTKVGSGTLTLAGQNTYAGLTAINAGALAMNNASALGTGTVSFGGGTLQYGPAVTTDLSARIADSSSAIAVDVGANNVTWATALASTNVGGLTKLGSGLLTLDGSNAYSGATAVDVGGLLVNGANGGSGLVTVANAARLGGDGSLAGGLSLLSGAQFVFDPLATLDVTGAVTLDNSFGVSSLVNADGTAINWASIATGTYTLINTTSTFGNIANFGVANAAPIDAGRTAYFQDGSLQLVVVPEPGAIALAAIGIAAAAWARRRSR